MSSTSIVVIEKFWGCYGVQRKGFGRTGEKKGFYQGELPGPNNRGYILKIRLKSVRWVEEHNLPKQSHDRTIGCLRDSLWK